MIPADVEDTGPFTVRDNETGKAVGLYHSLEAAPDVDTLQCDKLAAAADERDTITAFLDWLPTVGLEQERRALLCHDALGEDR